MAEPAQHTLLIADDDEVFRTRLGRAFTERHYAVQLARDYHEAITAARAQPPELAVLDLRMPGPSGLELLRDLLALAPATRAVVLTGYGSIATAVEAVRLGACNYVSKPADVEDILTAFSKGALAPLAEIPPAAPTPSLARVEWEHISRVLEEAGGNVSEAARRLGLHRRSLQRKLGKYPPRG